MTTEKRYTKNIDEVKLRTTHLESFKKRNLDTSHINIIKYITYCVDPKSTLIVMETSVRIKVKQP